ncbi:MAG: hypothetical protein ACYSTT_09815 [Planctomycetota bacterium]|jgi:hypothetical protein
MNKGVKVASVFLGFGLFFLAGCMKIGPTSINQDRFAYNDAISESWKRQMLLNMVKLRYADAPIFLDVASIINQYSLEAEVQGGLAWNAFLPEASQNVGARGRYADRPTITYQPLSGDKFTRSLMTPIPPSSILALIEAGWRADAVSWICIQAINGIYNRSGAATRAHQADPEFYQFMELFRRVQESRSAGMRIQETPDRKRSTVLFFRKKDMDPQVITDAVQLRKLLGLSPDLQEATVVYGSLPQNDRELAILTRSMLEILVELASYIEVPEVHVAEQRTSATALDDIKNTGGYVPEIRIQSSLEKSDDAFVAIKYRDYWFWIDDRDYQTKRAFSFLMFLFTLAETGESERAPVLTIPTG